MYRGATPTAYCFLILIHSGSRALGSERYWSVIAVTRIQRGSRIGNELRSASDSDLWQVFRDMTMAFFFSYSFWQSRLEKALNAKGERQKRMKRVCYQRQKELTSRRGEWGAGGGVRSSWPWFVLSRCKQAASAGPRDARNTRQAHPTGQLGLPAEVCVFRRTGASGAGETFLSRFN